MEQCCPIKNVSKFKLRDSLNRAEISNFGTQKLWKLWCIVDGRRTCLGLQQRKTNCVILHLWELERNVWAKTTSILALKQPTWHQKVIRHRFLNISYLIALHFDWKTYVWLQTTQTIRNSANNNKFTMLMQWQDIFINYLSSIFFLVGNISKYIACIIELKTIVWNGIL